MVCLSRIHDHAVQFSVFLEDLVHRFLYALFVCHVGFKGKQLTWKSLLDSAKVLIGGICDVYRDDLFAAVRKTAFSDSKADPAICAGDYKMTGQLL